MTTQVDTDAMHARYLAERDKRLRPDGNEQYIEPTGKFANYLDDPYVEPFEREPLFDDVTVAFIGGGFAGLVTGARLKQAGIDDVRIIEKGGDFGGTWYWNRYPGAQCDTAAFVYMPLLEETGHMPTEKYTHAPEILDHCRRIATHFDLYDNACLSTEVTGLNWDQDACRWIIRTNRGDEMRAKFVAMGTGPLHRPKLPGIPGIETYAGHSFHTSRWDYDYTGGDPSGAPMERLADKRVGIIGTGATAVQCVPHLSRGVRRAVRVPAHTELDRRAQQPADRSRLVRHPRTGLAAEVARELHDPADRRVRRRRLRDGRLDRHQQADPRQAVRGPRPRVHTRGVPAGLPRQRRREDDPDPRGGSTRSSTTRPPPRHSSRGTASCASGPASTTSTCSRSTTRTPT